MAAQRKKLTAGTQIRLLPGCVVPEVPPVDAQDWTGVVLEAKGKGDSLQYIVEWDEETEGKMPQEFIQQCEEQGLFYKMACLPHSDIESVE